MSKSHPTKICTVCGVERRINWHHRLRPDPYVCKWCQPRKLDTDRWKIDPEYRRGWNLARRYKIERSDYDALFNQQGGVCAICKSPPRTYRLAVDHDHSTGTIRGLLCTSCNSKLEWLQTFGERAREYLASTSRDS